MNRVETLMNEASTILGEADYVDIPLGKPGEFWFCICGQPPKFVDTIWKARTESEAKENVKDMRRSVSNPNVFAVKCVVKGYITEENPNLVAGDFPVEIHARGSSTGYLELPMGKPGDIWLCLVCNYPNIRSCRIARSKSEALALLRKYAPTSQFDQAFAVNMSVKGHITPENLKLTPSDYEIRNYRFDPDLVNGR